LALLYNILGQSSDATKNFKKAKELDKALNIKTTHSKPESKRILVDKANEEFSEAIMMGSTFTSVLMPLESAAKDIGLYNTLINIYKSILKEHPTYADFHHKLGQVYMNLHKYKKAIDEFLEAIKINPNYMHAHMNLAFAYKESGQSDRAIEEFQLILGKQLESASIYFQLAILYRDKNKAKAIELLNSALELQPDFKDAKALLKELHN